MDVTPGFFMRKSGVAHFADFEARLEGVYQPQLVHRRFSGDYIYRNRARAGTSFYYDVQLTPDEGERPDNYQVFSRWNTEAAGRADSNTTDVDSGALDGSTINCWDVDGRELYSLSSWNGNERGQASSCSYTDTVDPDEQRGRTIDTPATIETRNRVPNR